MSQIRMFINGQALRGGTLNDALANARFVGEVKTSSNYRFYAVRGEFPGLWPTPTGGRSIAGELYELSYGELRDELLPREPAELELTVIELEDGSGCLSMRMRDDALGKPGVEDITARGGWRAYLAQQQVQS